MKNGTSISINHCNGISSWNEPIFFGDELKKHRVNETNLFTFLKDGKIETLRISTYFGIISINSYEKNCRVKPCINDLDHKNCQFFTVELQDEKIEISLTQGETTRKGSIDLENLLNINENIQIELI